MSSGRFRLILYGAILVLLLLGLVTIFSAGEGLFLVLELVGFLLLLILTVVGFAGFNRHWGEKVLFWVFLFYIANLVLVWYFQNKLYLVLLFLAVLGLVLSFPHSKHKVQRKVNEEPHSMVFDSENPVMARQGAEKGEEERERKTERKPLSNQKEGRSEMTQARQVPTPDLQQAGAKEARRTARTMPQPAAKVNVKHIPGKYLASKRSNVYHEPKCEWARKIAKDSQIWFKSKEEAWEKGYKGHSCIVS